MPRTLSPREREKLAHILERGMTVEDLIYELKGYPPGTRVVFACDYGDHCHTDQALPIATVEALYPDEHQLYISGYSQSEVAIRELNEPLEKDPDDEEEETDPKTPLVIVLR